MATALCKERIKAEGGVPCSVNHCKIVQTSINKYCTHSGKPTDWPVPQVENGKECYCCCSCFAYFTPIEMSKGEFKWVQDIELNEKVIATNRNVSEWKEQEVTDLSGIAPGVKVSFMLYIVYQMEDNLNPESFNHIITTADHLFLLPDGTLRPIQDLRPGDMIRKADGGEAKIVSITAGNYDKGIRHISLGELVPGEVDGHLLNSNGVVTADFSVQLAFYSDVLDEKYLAPDLVKEEPSIGTSNYIQKYATPELLTLKENLGDYPDGFTPTNESLVNIPMDAKSFFTKEQAKAIIDSDLEHLSFINDSNVVYSEYLLQLLRSSLGNTQVIYDWKNEEPNAYYFRTDTEQSFIVLTGGLLRLKALNKYGLSLVLGHMTALYDGNTCVGDADYYGVNFYMRDMWLGDQFFTSYNAAYKQIKTIFEAIMNVPRGREDVCFNPGLNCRLECYSNASSMVGLPDCTKAQPRFVIDSVTVDEIDKLTVSFSRKLNKYTASSKCNYTIEIIDMQKNIRVKKAIFNQDYAQDVVLNIDALTSGVSYKLTVTGMLDLAGYPLSEKGDEIIFIAPISNKAY